MLVTLLNPLAILMSLSTATGVLIHDTHIDYAASALVMPVQANLDANKSVNLGGSDHTHVERVSLSHAIRHLGSENPRIQPRADDKKHLLQKRVMRGHHAFDNYNLPIV